MSDENGGQMNKWDRSLRYLHHGFAASSAAAVLTVVALVGVGPAAWGVAAHPSGQPRSYDFGAPDSVAVAGADLFVANGSNNSVTEVNASSGAFVATISGKSFGFDAPSAIVAVDGDLFVANRSGNSLTEFGASTRQHIRTVHGTAYRFSDPIALAPSGRDLFVLNGSGSITEISTASGKALGIVSGSAFKFDDPTGFAIADGRIFVANSAGNTVTVVNAANRTFVSSLGGSPFDFSTPKGVAFDGADMWVTNQGNQTMTEFSPSTLQEQDVLASSYLPDVGPVTYGDGFVFAVSPPGSSPMVSQITPSPANVNWMMCNTNAAYYFNNPEALVVTGADLWVVNEGGNSLTEMNADSGGLIGTFANP